jgi:hypothetical protein
MVLLLMLLKKLIPLPRGQRERRADLEVVPVEVVPVEAVERRRKRRRKIIVNLKV